MTVFDPSNYAQNLLTAARSLQQINNQIQSLQNQARNLKRVEFPEVQQITSTLRQIDALMGRANGVTFRLDESNQQLARLFPEAFNSALTTNQQVADANARLDASRAAYKQTMSIQSRIAQSVHDDAETLGLLVDRSQNAEGSLAATQATNQLIALTAKQQFQIQTLMTAQYRAQAIEDARRVQSEVDGRARTAKFLGSGSAYTPH
ncbi:MAG: P-type conjugative transfer protein TrbJ [Burkholderiales bacterium]|nr:MAG: P-type conjugative transfer protein TrbJ [Burkholderiales bacterium]